MTTTASQRDSGGTWRQHIAGFRQIWGLASMTLSKIAPPTKGAWFEEAKSTLYIEMKNAGHNE